MCIHICVIGGGAAGLTAAIYAARNGAKVTLLEQGDLLGRKILSTGNGKCNLGNRRPVGSMYHTDNNSILESVLSTFSAEDTIAFFRSLGVLVCEKNDGFYPYTESAVSVRNALENEIVELGIHVLLDSKVTEISEKKDRFEVRFTVSEYETVKVSKTREKRVLVKTSSKKEVFDRVIVSTGGCAAPKTGSDGSGYTLCEKIGISVSDRVPSLCAIHTKESIFYPVSGLRCFGKVSLVTDHVLSECTGEIQWTEYGISGIPVFQISGDAAECLFHKVNAFVHVDLFPDFSEKEWEDFYASRIVLMSRRTMKEFLEGMIGEKIAKVLLEKNQINMDMVVYELYDKNRAAFMALLKELRCIRLTVTGTNDFSQAQVTRGGVVMEQMLEDCSVKNHPGLYIVGELLNVDGACGGFNLHWAWATGAIAGTSASK